MLRNVIAARCAALLSGKLWQKHQSVSRTGVRAARLAGVLLCSFAVSATHAHSLVVAQQANALVMSNGNERVVYSLATGRADFFWRSHKVIHGFYSSVRLGRTVSSVDYQSRDWSFNSSNSVVVNSFGGRLPIMRQYFTFNDDKSFLTRVAIETSGTNSNWMAPIVVDGNGAVDIGVTNDNRALCVPFDNDHFVRYNAASINTTNKSFEVAAFFDNVSRRGLVVGSVAHDTWKTGIAFAGLNDRLNKLTVFGGITDSNATWDVLPHGSVSGRVISSPTVFVGCSDDWRDGLEQFAGANTTIAPKMSCTNGVPFGWNSWYAFAANIRYTNAIAVSDFIHTNLQPNGFSNDGTAYINLDSFWSNFTDAELVDFVKHCHANSQKAGIYWSPFVWWGAPAGISNVVVRGTPYHISDMALRTPDGKLQINDGGIALDPTHPAMKARMDHFLDRFIREGFDFLKLDFLTHGALEGVHYDTNITTGIQAYNAGMRYLVSRLGGRMFLSLSIAPLFPDQYGQARRVACDTAKNIGETEYEMESVTYGWWSSGRLYQYTDPDMMQFAGATLGENRSRLVSGAVAGTVFLNSDDLTSTAGQAIARRWLTNAAVNDVARVGRTFRPIEGNTGTKAADVFVRRDGTRWCVAVFNFGGATIRKEIDLSRAGITGNFRAVDLFSAQNLPLNHRVLSVTLASNEATLVRLQPE